MSTSGFYGAPITKALFFTTLGGSFIFSWLGIVDEMNLDLNAIINKGHFHRLLFNWLTFGEYKTGQLIVTLLLIYHFRIIERIIGSYKFSIFIFNFGIVLSNLIQIILLIIMYMKIIYIDNNPNEELIDNNYLMTGVDSGPLSIIFGMLWIYYRRIPHIQPHFFGVGNTNNRNQSSAFINFGSKTLYYILGLQLFFSNGYRSIIPCLSGIIAGICFLSGQKHRLYGIRSSLFNTLSNMKWPKPFEKIMKKIFLPLLISKDPHTRTIRVNTQQQQQQQLPNQPNFLQNNNLLNNFNNNNYNNFNIPIEPPSEESITALTSLGFNREQAIQALRNSHNNVEVAANHLLAG